ncbi:MAG: tetraacyldisaccharide 4'-kinase [Fusobacterium sp.]|nr:tetraacyldisaccharide 4'-kinase [Fusobacterium sp.]
MKILAYIYYLITNFRNFLYDKKILPIHKIDGVEIFCIGNISVGGTGKTPAVHFFVKQLLKKGRKVAVISRGYKGKRKREPLLVSDGMVIFATSQESGDEPYIHALNLKVPVIVGANRYKACKFAKKHFDIDTIVLDDGFQHRKLFRNFDVVLIDATNPFGSKNLLPLGLLREDFLKGGRRAKEFIITKADLIGERDLKRIKAYLKKKFQKEVSVAKHGVHNLCDDKGNMKPLFWVKNKKVLIFSGLANPLNFEKTVISLKPSYIERIDFKDHHSFKAKDIALIRKRAEQIEADYVLTTEKDFVKLPENMKIKNLLVLKIEFTMLEDNTLKYIK